MSQFDFQNLEKPFHQSKNALLIALTFMVTGTYFLIIFILQWNFSRVPVSENRNDQWVYTNMNLMLLISVGISLAILLLTHCFLLKNFHKKFSLDNPYQYYYSFFIIVSLNLMINVFGLWFCLLSIMQNHQLNWYYFIVYFGIGWSNLLYIYLKRTPAIYRRMSLKSPLK